MIQSIKLILNVALLLCVVGAVWAKAPAEANKEFYSETLPLILCQDDDYFRMCFSQSKNCKQEMVEIAKLCYEQNVNFFNQLKKQNSPEKAELSRNIKMGYCMGVEYEKKNKMNKKDDPKCYSQKNW